MPITKLLKIISGIAATILLGAIGSGVWEKLLAPGLNWLATHTAQYISSISSRYRDDIYASAAAGFNEDYSFRSFLIICLLITLTALIGAYWYNERMSGITKRVLGASKGWLHWTALAAAFTFALSTFLSVSRHEAVKRTTSYSIRSMEIVRPHIGEQAFHSLVSQYYQIRIAKDFEEFNNKLVQAAEEAKVRLPAFTPV
ncbi:hypothetical protein LNA76_04505 [Alcaligenes sp. MMA]|uniref:hypothetical protein n=1 Tax=Alcaligenes sp. MMA TaxID=2893019 RepID=UPI001E4E5235|nr:hypothetical protein [Alcaligenes sp. MMA]MCC9162581.1 hypothetical protein [Alcaligenes sp. MMA]